jgi:hypothetical protein
MRDPHVRESLSRLKQDIAGRVARSRALSAEARALSGVPRHQKQMERRALGRCTRWRLLAYTWLRGRAYARAEPHAVVPVDSWAIRRALDAVGVAADIAALRRWLQGEAPVAVPIPAAEVAACAVAPSSTS